MTAPTLFDANLAPVHHGDPETSRFAAAKVRASDQFHLVLRTLAAADEPLTDDEIAERTGLLRTSAGTRRGVAVRRCLVAHAGFGVSALGNTARTWTLTADGRRYVAELEKRTR
jgi:hypothetical protein